MEKINGLSEVIQESDTIKINELISLRYQLDILLETLETRDKTQPNFYTKIEETCKLMVLIQELLGEIGSIPIQKSGEIMQISADTTKKVYHILTEEYT